MTSPGAWVAVAKVRTVQPQRRELRLDETPPFVWPEPDPQWVNARAGGAAPRKLKVAKTSRDGNSVVLELAPGVPREVVASLRGAELVVSAGEIETYRSGAWYPPEWVGYAVRDEKDEMIGGVREVWDTPANAVLTVETKDQGTWLLPVIPEVVLRVNREAATIVITGIEPHGVPHAG